MPIWCNNLDGPTNDMLEGALRSCAAAISLGRYYTDLDEALITGSPSPAWANDIGAWSCRISWIGPLASLRLDVRTTGSRSRLWVRENMTRRPVAWRRTPGDEAALLADWVAPLRPSARTAEVRRASDLCGASALALVEGAAFMLDPAWRRLSYLPGCNEDPWVVTIWTDAGPYTYSHPPQDDHQGTLSDDLIGRLAALENEHLHVTQSSRIDGPQIVYGGPRFVKIDNERNALEAMRLLVAHPTCACIQPGA